MNLLGFAEEVLQGIVLIGAAATVLGAIAKWVGHGTRGTVDWKPLVAELLGILLICCALLLALMLMVVMAFSSRSGWLSIGFSLSIAATLVWGLAWGLALLLALPSKWQIWDWVEKGILISFLTGGAMVLFQETHSHVQKTLLSCDFRSGGTLTGAVVGGDTLCVDHWLRQDIPSEGGRDQPLLYVAVTADNALVLSRLLDSGRFNPNQPAAHGDTPLHAAVRKGRRDMVCLLLSHGSNEHFPNGDNVTPLDLAADRDLIALLEGDVCLT